MAEQQKMTNDRAESLAKLMVKCYRAVCKNDMASVTMLKAANKISQEQEKGGGNVLDATARVMERTAPQTETSNIIFMAAALYLIEVEPTLSPNSAKLLREVADIL